MKLLYKNIDFRTKAGIVGILPEDDEDMWHIYNLIQTGDHLRASTMRKIVTESKTGTTAAHKVRITLTVSIEQVEYDFDACALRVKGKNVEENEYVKMGQYHTLDVERNRKFSLKKDEWDVICLERLELACDPSKSADLAAIVMEEGIAHVCLVTSSMTLVRAKIESNIPRKRRDYISQHQKGMSRFFEQVAQSICRHVNFDVVKCVLIASPGFVKDQFYQYLLDKATKEDLKVILENKSKFVLCHSSSGFKHSLKEVLTDPKLQSRLSDTKAASEVKALEAFHTMLGIDPDKAFYGLGHVEKAAEMQAIDTLLISDKLFRVKDVAKRKRFIRLVESVKEMNGDVKIFSSLHVSGEQLDQLSGVAAILRYPIPDLEEEAIQEEDDLGLVDEQFSNLKQEQD